MTWITAQTSLLNYFYWVEEKTDCFKLLFNRQLISYFHGKMYEVLISRFVK